MHPSEGVHNVGHRSFSRVRTYPGEPKMFDMSLRNDSSNGPIRTVSALLTAIPGFFGFIPERSLVLLALAPDGRTVQASVRLDLDLAPDGSPARPMLNEIDNLARIFQGYGSADLIAVIGDDRFELDTRTYEQILSKVDRRMRLCGGCLLYTSPSPRDRQKSRMPSSA